MLDNWNMTDLFGIFTGKQERQISRIASAIIESCKNEKITLYLYGCSRGGVGAFMLCNLLSKISDSSLTIHASIFCSSAGKLQKYCKT